MDYFKKLQELLATEKEVDKQAYQELVASSSVTEKRANGLVWYPIAIKGTEMSRGDYLTVEVERTTHQDILHQIRFGVPAALFSQHDAKNCNAAGIIAGISGNTLRITLQIDELPDWSRNGKLGIELLFDDNSYDEMNAALKYAAALREKKEGGQLARILTGQATPAHSTDHSMIPMPRLNPSQTVAVNNILAAKELAIVHGPPGTGKTTTLVQAIGAILTADKRPVLVVAPSNTAVDLLSEKLAAEGLNVLRVGNPVRVSEKLISLTLDSRMAAHPQMKEIKKLKKQANEFRNMAHKYKRNFGHAERAQRKALFEEAYKIMKEVNQTEQYIMDDIIAKAQVITATLVGSNHYTVQKLKYHTVVIDEAGQALEPACWIPIVKAQKLVLAGDPFQLPPTVKSEAAGNKGLRLTLLEKCIALHPSTVTLLEEQYRMNEIIMGYSSGIFYQNKLKAAPAVAHHLLFAGDKPLEFIDTAGCGFEEKLQGTSATNPEEAAFLYQHLNLLVATLNNFYQEDRFPSIAIISPYKQQISLLKDLLVHQVALKPFLSRITVNTIDGFQGQESDIVYIGMTRSNSETRIGFLSDIRRMNVAMTRARKKLVVMGDSATLSALPFYRHFITYAEEHLGYTSAWEYRNE